MKHLCKTFRHTPLPFSLTPFQFTGAILALRDRRKTLSHISQNDQIDRSPIFHARYLYRVLTECCHIFNIGKGHNYLRGKPPKCAIFEILSLSFSQ